MKTEMIAMTVIVKMIMTADAADGMTMTVIATKDRADRSRVLSFREALPVAAESRNRYGAGRQRPGRLVENAAGPFGLAALCLFLDERKQE